MRRLKVMLVEDNDFTRSTVAAALRVEQCDVVASVSSAKEAVNSASELDFDCAVIDLHLGSGPSGIDLAYSLRRKDPDLGIVILTSFQDPRLFNGDQRPLPPGAVYAVKDDMRTTHALREQVDIATGITPRPIGSVSGYVPLTDLQVEILRLVAQGLTNAEIAKRRVTSARSVETTIARILRRLDIEPTPDQNPRVLLTQAYHSMVGGGVA
ncbi:MAG: response regulator transcription factor [Candidatus Nanopelagicales bacterium]|nr:response regulator transcription factor [Candidatus Nanopelagicales bacterium]MCF8539837.1 response regulator transcription factor [Candidatus Nanopelagicales bacterium]